MRGLRRSWASGGRGPTSSQRLMFGPEQTPRESMQVPRTWRSWGRLAVDTGGKKATLFFSDGLSGSHRSQLELELELVLELGLEQGLEQG